MKKWLDWMGIASCLPLLAAGLVLTLCGCGGGGGGSGGGDSSGAAATPSSAGSVAILLTDGPTNEFSEVNVTIQRIELLSDSGKVTVFSSAEGKMVNLLQLENEAQLFELAENVPAGRYDKIRLGVSQVELVRPDQTSVLAELPANGKIDLNPREPFYVIAGQTLLVQLDMDAGKAIHIVNAGNASKYLFRPVVFVTILKGEVPGKLVRLSGQVEQLNEDSFLLCPPLQVETLVDDPNVADRCIQVDVTADTSFFDPFGDPVGFANLQVKDQVQVIGRFEVAIPDNTNGAYSLPRFAAVLVEIGTYLRLDGSVLSVPESVDGTRTFQLQVEPGQGLAGDLVVETVLFDGDSKIFSSDGNPLDVSALTPGARIAVDGVLVIPDGEGQKILKAALIIVKSTEALAERQGTIAAIDLPNATVQITQEDQSEICADIVNAEMFRVITNSVVDVQPILSPEELNVGDQVLLFGMEGATCFEVKYLFVTD